MLEVQDLGQEHAHLVLQQEVVGEAGEGHERLAHAQDLLEVVVVRRHGHQETLLFTEPILHVVFDTHSVFVHDHPYPVQVIQRFLFER